MVCALLELRWQKNSRNTGTERLTIIARIANGFAAIRRVGRNVLWDRPEAGRARGAVSAFPLRKAIGGIALDLVPRGESVRRGQLQTVLVVALCRHVHLFALTGIFAEFSWVVRLL